MWLYARRLEAEYTRKAERYRMVYMQMDWLARVFTGEDTKLLQEFETAMNKNNIHTPAEKTIEQQVKEEAEMLAGLEALGFKVNKT